MEYNHKQAIAQMAKEVGCDGCRYFHPHEPIVCNRPDRREGIKQDKNGKCLAIKHKEG